MMCHVRQATIGAVEGSGLGILQTVYYIKTTPAGWPTFADVKNDFNSVDGVGNQHFVFNLKGNDYRLVVVIKFQIKMVFIRFIGTHSEYNKIDCVKSDDRCSEI